MLLPLVPDIAAAARPPGRAARRRWSGDGGADRACSAAIAGLFQQQRQPILLLLEDLHWAEESLLPLPSCSAARRPAPLLVVGSYRDDERPELPQQLPEHAASSRCRA